MSRGRHPWGLGVSEKDVVDGDVEGLGVHIDGDYEKKKRRKMVAGRGPVVRVRSVVSGHEWVTSAGSWGWWKKQGGGRRDREYRIVDEIAG